MVKKESYPWIRATDNRWVVSQQELVKYILSPENPNPVVAVSRRGKSDPEIMVYQDGFYQPLQTAALNGYIKGFIPVDFQEKRTIDEVRFLLSCETPVDESLFDADEDIVNFNNGIFHLSTGQLTRHSPEILSSVRIPCDYREAKLEEAPVFSQFLNDLTTIENDIDQAFLLEYIGAIISNVPGYRFKKCLILVGPGNTGKSQLRQLVISIIGAKNCQTMDLGKLNDRFSTSQLYGKRLCGSGDMSFMKVQELSTLKNLTGGDDINAEFKGKDAFSFVYSGYLWFNTNELPAFGGDKGKHVYDRFNIITCNNIIPPERRDRKLLDKMLGEKEVIVSVALRYFSDAVKRGYEFSESESMAIMRESYMSSNNSLITFVNECCDLGISYKVKRSEFRRLYLAWCKAENLFPERRNTIDQTLKEEFGIITTKSSDYFYDGLDVKLEIHTEYEKKY